MSSRRGRKKGKSHRPEDATDKRTMRDRTREKVLEFIKSAAPFRNGGFVLLCDKVTLPLVSSCCSKFELVELGCTLIQQVDLVPDARCPQPELDVVYFVLPTIKTFERIADDFKVLRASVPGMCACQKMQVVQVNALMYSAAHIFCTHAIPTDCLEVLKHRSESVVTTRVKTLAEVGMEYCAIESHIFDLMMPDDLRRLFWADEHGKPDAAARDEATSEIAEKLLSLIVTMGEYPSIRYRYDSPNSQAVATKLKHKLSEYMTESGWEKSKRPNGWRPYRYLVKPEQAATVLILDRSIDPVCPLLHEMTYQAMVQDLVPLEPGNKFTFKDDDGKDISVLLNAEDPIWSSLRHSHIHDFAAAMKKEEREIKSLGATGGDSLESMAETISKLPEHTKRIKTFKAHMALATKTLSATKRPAFLEAMLLEQTLAIGVDESGYEYNRSKLKPRLEKLLAGDSLEKEEKLRLLALYLMCTEQVKPAEINELCEKAQLGEDEHDAVFNLHHVGSTLEHAHSMVRVDGKVVKSNLSQAKSFAKKTKFKHSRYRPLLRDIVEQHISDTLDEEVYPYTGGHLPPPGRPREMSVMHRSSKETVTVFGPRLIVFVIGGVTPSEMRSVYQVVEKQIEEQTAKKEKFMYVREVILGATSILTPHTYLTQLEKMDGDDDDDESDEGTSAGDVNVTMS